jgi:hypothetical protein
LITADERASVMASRSPVRRLAIEVASPTMTSAIAPTSTDDRGVHTPPKATTPGTVDDHGTDVTVANNSTPVTVDDHGIDNAPTRATTPGTVDDHGTDTTAKTPANTPTTVDDHGGEKGKSGNDSSPSHH